MEDRKIKVAVTGGAGKAGRWVVRELLSGAEVVVFDRARGPEVAGVRCVVGDIQELGQVAEALSGADAVIHLAGVPTHGVVSDEATFRTNVMGTFCVHEAALRLGIGRVVTISSEAVLGWAPGSWVREHVPEYLPIDEDHPTLPQDAYGLSKVASEAVARSYATKSGMTAVVLRPPWIVSPEELEQLRASGGVKPTRFALLHYVDARDLAVACRLAIERPLSGCNVMFVGSGESLVDEPLATLYPKLMPAIGDKASALTGSRASVSTEKARALLGWAPKYSWRRPTRS